MKKQILLRVLLCLTLAVGLLPTMVFASGVTDSGKEADPHVYEVRNDTELLGAVAAINADTSNSARYTISLQEDIACSGLSFSRNTTTILGNGHKLTFKNYGGAIQVGSETETPPVLILGGAQGTLTIEGDSSNDTYNDTYFIGVGAINGGTEYGTLKMCDGVTITGATGNNYFGGAVTVAGGGKFEMDSGSKRVWDASVFVSLPGGDLQKSHIIVTDVFFQKCVRFCKASPCLCLITKQRRMLPVRC